ncbi:MAG TPA: SAM-dependent methyltransferase [Planctomycetaceae bacterium]|jgi:methyltransferase (TIGR00027 family)|nr:SAM-dependent methyltransferase [Planctomycetaceae bacterium]
MIPTQSSRMAELVALHRAAHQLLDLPTILSDPLAIDVLGAEVAAAIRANPQRYETERHASYLRAFVAVRARFTEEQLAQLRAGGLGQYVVLGAGLDTSAYRIPQPKMPLRVWEVDHPATQAWKQELLRQADITIPAQVTFVPIDFEHQTLPEVLAAAGFDASAGALFSWLGVVPYLTRPAIFSTLGFVAAATRARGGVVFDYSLAPEVLTPRQLAVYHGLSERVRSKGEPFQSSFAPIELIDRLKELGFQFAQDFSTDALNARYTAERADGLRVGQLAHIMWAGATPAV